MRDRHRSVIAPVVLALVTLLSWGDHAAACSCASPPQERLTLTLDSVTVDGAAASVDPYQGLTLTVVAGYSSVSLYDPRDGSESVTYAAY